METVTVTLEADESDELELPVTLLDRLRENDESDIVVVGDLATLSLAQQAHGMVHHGDAADEQLEAAEEMMMELFEERFGQTYAEVTGHSH